MWRTIHKVPPNPPHDIMQLIVGFNQRFLRAFDSVLIFSDDPYFLTYDVFLRSG